jgi:hypothetical protein
VAILSRLSLRIIVGIRTLATRVIQSLRKRLEEGKPEPEKDD